MATDTLYPTTPCFYRLTDSFKKFRYFPALACDYVYHICQFFLLLLLLLLLVVVAVVVVVVVVVVIVAAAVC